MRAIQVEPYRVLRVAVALLATAASAAAQPAPPRVDPAAVRDYAALLRSADRRVVDSSAVVGALRSSSPVVRRAGVLAIGQMQARAYAPALRSALTDRDTAVAANAAFALGLLHDTASVDALAGALGTQAPVALDAAWALGEIGEPARAAVEAALARGTARRVPELLVASYKLVPAPLTRIAPYARDASPFVRRAAVYAMGSSRLPAAIRPLLGIAGDPDPLVRAYVARGLARAAPGDSLADTTRALLAVLVHDADAHVRVEAARALGNRGRAAAMPLLAVTRDRDANVRMAAAQSLARLLDSVPGAFASAWGADTALEYRALLLRGAPDSTRAAWARDGEWRRRAAAVSTYRAEPRDAAVAAPVVAALADSDARVREAAVGALATAADSGAARDAARALLRARLADTDPYVRGVALGALESAPSARDVISAVAAFRAAGVDSGDVVRAPAVALLAHAWRNDSASFTPALRDSLAALPAPERPLVRQAAGKSSPFAAWPEPPAATADAQSYEPLAAATLAGVASRRNPRVTFVTARGEMVVELFAADAPLTVRNFLTLARRGYYRGTRFHRVVPDFVAQDGDPRGTGEGGPGYAIRDEFNRRRYARGVLGMALSGPDTGGSQYFLTLSPQPHLDGHYTVFGRLVRGADVLDRIVQGDAIVDVVPR